MAQLSPGGERHFYRLLLRADDWGCLECTPPVIWGACYSLHRDISPADVGGWNDELENAGVIRRWTDGERMYAVWKTFDKHNCKYGVTDDGKSTRHRRKTPAPPTDIESNGLSQPLPASNTFEQSVSNPNPNPNPNPKSKDKHYRRTVPDASAFYLRDYQTEVLNKCVGRQAGTEHPKAGLLWKIAKEGGSELVNTALAAMQDARNNNRNPNMETVDDLEAYYFATVRNMFEEQGIETTINWNGGEK
jgi:hypothetical protein